jgi:hypothetical protein
MSYQCDICPDVFQTREDGTFYDQNRVLTSPGYWDYQFTTKSTSFEENMLNQFLDMLSKDSSGFNVCNNCKSMLEKDIEIAVELGIEKYIKSIHDGKVDINSAGIVLGSVWKKKHGTWPSSIKITGFDTSKKHVEMPKEINEQNSKVPIVKSKQDTQTVDIQTNKTSKLEFEEKEIQIDKIIINDWTKHFSITQNTGFLFLPEITVNEPSLLKIKCLKKPTNASFYSESGKLIWHPTSKDNGMHTVELEVSYRIEKTVIKFQIEVSIPEVIEEPSLALNPSFPKKINQEESFKSFVKCNHPEFYGLRISKLPGFATFKFVKPEESGEIKLKPGQHDSGIHELVFIIYNRKDESETKDFVFKIHIEEKSKIEKPKEKEKIEKLKSIAYSQIKSWLPTIAILFLVIVVSFSIIYFRPSEYLPSPLTASPEIIQSEKAAFESWLKQYISEKIQFAQISGGLGDVQINKILTEIVKESREKINYTILEKEVDLSIPRIRQIINKVK